MDKVLRKLTREDSSLLSVDALYMILDSGWGTVREAGNDVAHGRAIPEALMRLNVLKEDLSGTSAEIFSNIYQFAYNATL